MLEDAAAPPPASGVWASLRDAVRGTRQSYTDGPIGRAIVLLAVPMVLEMSMESVFAVMDVFFVSRLGAASVATVGLTESLLVLVYTMAMGLSIGVTATVARRIGEGDADGAARTAVQGIALGILAAAIIAGVGVPLAPRLLGAMGAAPDVITTGSRYAAIVLGGNGVIVLLFLINAVFRGAGDAVVSMRVLAVANALNIVLGPCFIFGLGPFPRLGVTGAAVATTIGRGSGVLLQLYLLTQRNGRIRVRRRHVHLDFPLMWRLLRLSASGIVQVLIGSASWIGLVRVIASFGSFAVAGYTIGMRVILFALLPSFGMANAAATMVGQALGAGKPDRAERAVWQAGRYNMVFLTIIGIVFFVAARPIVGIFTSDPAITPHAVACLRIVSVGFPFYAFGMVLTQSFNGAGDTWTPTLMNLGCFWLWEIPLAWLLSSRFALGPAGVFTAIALAFSTLAVVSAILFRRGTWKRQRV